MTDHNPILEDDDMGGNFAKSEKTLGAEAFKVMRDAEKLFNKHDKLIGEIHAKIIEFGLKLQIGRNLYAFDNVGFNDWITRCKLDTGRILGSQQERTAAMTIARLNEVGYVEDEENAIPLKLDLTECKRARPTDIVKWAREKQPELFADLRARKTNADKKKQFAGDEDADDDPDDGIGDLGSKTGVGEDQWITDLKAEIVRLKARVAELEQENAGLRERLGDTGETEGQPAAHGSLSWSGSDAAGWTARSSEIDLCYEVKRTKARGSKWNVVVYEGGSDGQRLNLNPIVGVEEAKAAVEAYYAEQRAG